MLKKIEKVFTEMGILYNTYCSSITFKNGVKYDDPILLEKYVIVFDFQGDLLILDRETEKIVFIISQDKEYKMLFELGWCAHRLNF